MSTGTGRRRSRVLRLRRWVLGLAVTFTVMLVALIGYARYRTQRAILNLPHQLGIDIKSETDGFTYSQTVKGRTLFTIHAAKAIQHKDGKTILHDVSVAVHGTPGSDRTDTIRGADFEYDQANGIVRAVGDTLLDVGVPDDAEQGAGTLPKRIAIRGKGFVFLQKLGVASTGEPVHFQYGASKGDAVGADYELDTGVLTLQHAVHLSSAENGHEQTVDAASAQIDRKSRTVLLQHATVRDADQTMGAERITANLRSAGEGRTASIERIRASGNVVLALAGGSSARAPELEAELSATNKPVQIAMRGGVHLQDDTAKADAQRAVVHLDGGIARRLILTGSARLDRAGSPGETQILEAEQIEADLTGERAPHLVLSELRAGGAAKLILSKVPKESGQAERTELTAAFLTARTAPGANRTQLQSLDARGGTRLFQADGLGDIRTSRGDTLHALFAPADSRDANALRSVVQEGHVIIRERRDAVATQPGSAERRASQTDAVAERVEFEAATDRIQLSGKPRVTSDGLQVEANSIVLHRNSGDAEATGTVRGVITSSPDSSTSSKVQEPVHFAAASARLSRGSGGILLLGDNTGARLWTNAGQIEAPSIQADQRAGSLHALSGGANAAAGQVKTILLQTPSQTGLVPGYGSGRPSERVASALRAFSREAWYVAGTSGKPASARFGGGVRLLQGGDVIAADTVTAVLQAGGLLGGSVQSIAADGRVRVQQGSRTATGNRLLYTAVDRRAVLTGTPDAPPVVRDPVQGTVSGRQLSLLLGRQAGDNQVEVTGATDAPVQLEVIVPERTTPAAQPARPRVSRKSRATP